MKKLLILSFLSIAFLNTGCNNKSSTSTYETSSGSTASKCPNCGSTSYHPHETVPSMKICNTCEIGY